MLSKVNYTVEQGYKISIRGKILTSDNKNTNRYHKILVLLNNRTIQRFYSRSNLNFTINTTELDKKEYNLTIMLKKNGAYKEKRLGTKIYITNIYNKVFDIQGAINDEYKHIVVNIDDDSYELKDLIKHQPTKKIFNGTLVVIEKNLVKVKFNDTKRHNSSREYYDDILKIPDDVWIEDNCLISYEDTVDYDAITFVDDKARYATYNDLINPRFKKTFYPKYLLVNR